MINYVSYVNMRYQHVAQHKLHLHVLQTPFLAHYCFQTFKMLLYIHQIKYSSMLSNERLKTERLLRHDMWDASSTRTPLNPANVCLA